METNRHEGGEESGTGTPDYTDGPDVRQTAECPECRMPNESSSANHTSTREWSFLPALTSDHRSLIACRTIRNVRGIRGYRAIPWRLTQTAYNIRVYSRLRFSGLAKPISIGTPVFCMLTITALSGRTSMTLYLMSSCGFRENSWSLRTSNSFRPPQV
jgi:hypothetical protein